MRATVEAKDLARAMREVAPAAGKEWPIPVLANVLIEAREGRLRLTCMNLDGPKQEYRGGAYLGRVGMSVLATVSERECCRVRECRADIEAEGTTTVPAKLLRDLTKELKTGPIELELQIQEPLQLTRKDTQWQPDQPEMCHPGKWVLVEVKYPTEAVHTLEVRYRRLNFVAHLKAIAAEEFPPLYRDIDLGEWSWAPIHMEVAA